MVTATDLSSIHASGWHGLSSELLNDVFSKLTFNDNLGCEEVCKSWHSVLSDNPQPGTWGDTWTLLNASCKYPQQEVDQDTWNVVIRIPRSDNNDDMLRWILSRVRTVYRINLGDCNHPVDLYTDPVDLYTDPYAELLVQQTLAELREAVDNYIEVSVYLRGMTSVSLVVLLLLDCTPHTSKYCNNGYQNRCCRAAGGFRLSSTILELLPSLCTSLSLGPGLTSVDVAKLSTLTRLAHLDLRINNSDQPLRRMPMDHLTKLTCLADLELYFPPKLPASGHRFEWLESLTLAPRTSATVNLTQYKHLTYLCFSPSDSSNVPVMLPSAADNCLISLAVHACCDFQNLEDAQHLRRIEVSPYAAVFDSINWPASLPKLDAIEIYQSSEYYSYDRYYDMWSFRNMRIRHLPDDWQNYTGLLSLKVPFYQGRDLPDCFSTLQQLKWLYIPSAPLAYFPDCLSRLSQLRHLGLDKVEGFLDCDNVVGLADLEHLTYLNFGLQLCISGTSRSDYNIQSLMRLSAALHAKDTKMVRKEYHDDKHTDIWTFVKGCLDSCDSG